MRIKGIGNRGTFEMRMHEATRERLDTLSASYGITRAAVIRLLLDPMYSTQVLNKILGSPELRIKLIENGKR